MVLVEEERQRLAAAVDAPLEFGVGLRERARRKVGPPQLEVPDPGIELRVRVVQEPQRIAAVAIRQRDDAVDD